MTLRNSEKGHIFTKKPFKFWEEAFERHTFQKTRKSARRENKKSFVPKYLGTFNKKKLPLFDKSLVTLEFLHQTMLSFKGMRFCSMFGSNHKRMFGKLIERHLYLSPFPENGFHHSRFPANFLKVFKKRRTAAL